MLVAPIVGAVVQPEKDQVPKAHTKNKKKTIVDEAMVEEKPNKSIREVPPVLKTLLHELALQRLLWPHYRCNTPYHAIHFQGDQHSPKMVPCPPTWYSISHWYISAIPHFATHRAIIVRYPIKTSTKEFCNMIATSMARYEKYRCWASKQRLHFSRNIPRKSPSKLVFPRISGL